MKKKNTILHKIISRKILYLADKNIVLQADGTPQEGALPDKVKPSVVILAKHFYFETVIAFPFAALKEISAAVKMDVLAYCPFETDLFFVRKISLAGDQTKVNIWFVMPEAVDELTKTPPWLILPETFLLSVAAAGKPMVYAIECDGNKRLLTAVSQHGEVKSMQVGTGTTDSDFFRRSVGGDINAYPQKELVVSAYYALLYSSINSLTLATVRTFFNPRARALDQLNKKQFFYGLCASFVIFCCYLSLSMFLPWQKLHKLEQEDAALSTRIVPLLSKQDDIRNYLLWQKKIAKVVNSYEPKLPLFNLFSGILPEGTAIRQLIFSGNMVEMRGTTLSGSELMESLSGQKGVHNPRFTAPLRDDKKTSHEHFTLTFIYNRS